MTFAFLTALLGFAFVATVTPGPNNLMLMAPARTSASAGPCRTMLGIVGGVSVMALPGWGGADGVVRRIACAEPGAEGRFRWLPALACIQDRDGRSRGRAGRGQPSDDLSSSGHFPVGRTPRLGPCACPPSRSTRPTLASVGSHRSWCVSRSSAFRRSRSGHGSGLWSGQWLSNATRLRVFNFTMAAFLVASLYPVLGLGT